MLWKLDREVACFELLFDECEEPLGVCAIDHAMVETEGKIGHPTNADEVVAVGCSHDFGLFFNLADTENCQLRLVDDRRSEQAAEHAWVRDREGAAGHFVGFQLLGPGAVSKIICSACESGNAQIVSAF